MTDIVAGKGNLRTSARGSTTNPCAADRRKEADTSLINAIYEAAENIHCWEGALTALARAHRSTWAALISHDRDAKQGSIIYSCGIPEALRREYKAQFASINPWVTAYASACAFGTAISGESMLPAPQLRKTQFFRKFLLRLGMIHTMHAGIAKDGPLETHLVLGRPESQKPYGHSEIDALQPFVGHVVRAWRIGDRLSRVQLLSRQALQALDHLSVGVLILDKIGQVLAMNREARAIIERGEGVGIGPDGLEVIEDGRTKRLSAILARDQWPCRFRLLAAQSPSGSGQIALLVRPLEDASGRGNAGVLVFVSDPHGRTNRFDPEIIGRFYSMTPAEARLAARMAHGNNLDGVAGELGISIHTARTHLKRIFEKTGVDRQSALVYVLQNAFGFLCPDGETTSSCSSD